MSAPPRGGRRPRLSAVLLGTVLALVLAGCSGPSSPASSFPAPSCGPAPAGFAHREATVNGTRLHYVVGGSGPGIVLLHGFPETWQSWSQAARAAAPAPLAFDGAAAADGTAAGLREVATDVREVRIADAGHYALQERPDEFAAQLLRFIDGQ